MAGRSEFGYWTIVLAAAVLLSASTGPAEETQPGIPLHHFELSCDLCHKHQSADPHPQLQSKKNVFQVKDDINRLCALSGCHDFDVVLNHPVGVKPNGPVPPDMPLDTHARITCLTCHSAPNVSDGSDHTGLSVERSLQSPSGMEFCAACHMKTGGTLLEQSHWRFSTRAHLGSINPRTDPLENTEHIPGCIDTESHTCLSCHEDITVTVPSRNETLRQKRARWNRMSDHPIGMDYQWVASRQMRRYILPLTDPRLRLFSGSVGCGTCHSPYSRVSGILIMRNQRGALCRRCHNM